MSCTFTYTGSITFTHSFGDVFEIHRDTPPLAYYPTHLDCTWSEAPAGAIGCALYQVGGASGAGQVIGGLGATGSASMSVDNPTGAYIQPDATASRIQTYTSFPQLPVPWTVTYTINVTYSDCTEPVVVAVPSRLATIVG